MADRFTPGPWDYVPSTEHHGPYVTSDFGSTICDLYTMSKPGFLSTANGGDSKPIPFLHEMADPNAQLIAAAPELLAALQGIIEYVDPEGIGTFDGATHVAANRPSNGELVLKGSFIQRCMDAAAAIRKAIGEPS